MNERIRELAKEARLLTGWTVGEVEYQKFAELIVRECITQCQREIFTNGRYTDHNIAIHSCMDSIKAHFGVDK